MTSYKRLSGSLELGVRVRLRSDKRQRLLSKCTGVEIHSFRSHIIRRQKTTITSFGVEIHAQNTESTHKRVIQTTTLEWIPLFWEWISTPNDEVIPNMTPKRVDFHFAALRELILIKINMVNKSLYSIRIE